METKTTWDKLVSDKELCKIKNLRIKSYYEKKDWKSAFVELQKDGWSQYREYKDKRFIGIRKTKPFDEQFEDRVWCLFYALGFKIMNSDRHFIIQYDGENNSFSQQIDVLALDEETILVIECKAAQQIKDGKFKTEIEAFRGKIIGIRKELLKKYPGAKVKFIWATQNYRISEEDRKRLKGSGNEEEIILFSEAEIKYYENLSKYLGTSARYQLLGALFANTKIKNMDTSIPAIEGKMGGYTYYSFSIEPEKLLKISYVLHRSQANNSLMPTYQRLIKRKRLIEVRKFVEEGGFFPNSIIISIDTNGKGLVFDRAKSQVSGAISKIGILHLPQKYRSAYIIDGQHRLYGYSDSKYSESNSIPVVAFVDLDRSQQLRLFMEINENQKSVSKTLRNCLTVDMDWDSDDKNNQRKALRSHIAQRLGEDISSPLYKRVILEEDEETKNPIKCITIEAIQNALKSCHFFNVYKNNKLIKNGTFDGGTNDSSLDLFYPVLLGCLDYLKAKLPVEWEKGESDNGLLTINSAIGGVIRVIDDIVNYLIDKKQVNPLIDKKENMIDNICYFLSAVVKFYETMSDEQRTTLRKSYGGGGVTELWRNFQKSINAFESAFCPDGMIKYFEDKAKKFNTVTYEHIMNIEMFMKNDFRERLMSKYGSNGDDWFRLGVPQSVYVESTTRAAEENAKRAIGTEEIKPWDKLYLIDYRKIAIYGSNWSELFEKKYGEDIKGNKEVRTEWMVKLGSIRNIVDHRYCVSEEQSEYVKKIYNWIVKS